MIDYHTHIGQFYDFYTSPSELIHTMDSVGVERFACSSTTICEGNYDKVLMEMSELQMSAGHRLLPVLWIVPQMLQDDELQRFLDSDIRWRMLKIHPQLHPLEWKCGGDNLRKVLRLAKQMQVPLLIHTGEFAGCYPLLFERAIRYNPSVMFILAHGRPIDETITLLQRYPNVVTDTAFMPVEHIAELCRLGLSYRILWGTDIPIQRYYNHDESLVDYCKNRLIELRNLISSKDYKTIMSNHL
jgi:predicted TIM-barrel fold metal-dependent hydrolase